MSTQDTTGQLVPFASILQQIGKGSAHEELSTELQRLVRAVVARAVVVDLSAAGYLTIPEPTP